MRKRLAVLFSVAVVLVFATAGLTYAKSPNANSGGIPQISDAQLKALYTTIGGGAVPTATTRTVANCGARPPIRPTA